jgi:hypothetical protein
MATARQAAREVGDQPGPFPYPLSRPEPVLTGTTNDFYNNAKCDSSGQEVQP